MEERGEYVFVRCTTAQLQPTAGEFSKFSRQPTMCSEPATSVPSKGHLVVAVGTGSGVLGIILDGTY